MKDQRDDLTNNLTEHKESVGYTENKESAGCAENTENTEPVNETFSYTYSAVQQQEIRKIREKYLPKDQKETAMEQLRRLDKSAAGPGSAISIMLGVVGTLLMGTGMSCTMVWTDQYFIPGIVIGVIGMLVMAGAYPAYVTITRKQREKIAPKILELSEQLLDEYPS